MMGRKLLCERFGGKKGQSIIEYAILLAIVIAVIVGAQSGFFDKLKAKITAAGKKIEEAPLE